MGKEGRKRSRRKRQRKGGGRRQVHGSSHQRVVLIESLRGVCSSLLIWLNIPGWLRRRYRRAKIHTERARRADLTYRTNSRARPVPRDYGLPFPWCASWVTIALSLSLPLSSRISFSEFLQSTCIHIGKAKSPIAVFRRGIERADRVGGEAIYIRRRARGYESDKGGWEILAFEKCLERRKIPQVSQNQPNSYGLIDIVRRFHVENTSINVSSSWKGEARGEGGWDSFGFSCVELNVWVVVTVLRYTLIRKLGIIEWSLFARFFLFFVCVYFVWKMLTDKKEREQDNGSNTIRMVIKRNNSYKNIEHWADIWKYNG